MPGLILTTTPTPKEIKAQLLVLFRALIAEAPTVLRTIDLDGECEIEEEYLPVLIGLATRGVVETVKNGERWHVTRNYEFRVLYAKVASKAPEDQLAAVSVADQMIDEIPGWLVRFPQLGLTRGIRGAGRATDQNGVELHHWRDEEWAGVTHLLPVTTTS